MGCLGKLLDVQHGQGGVRDGFAEHQPGVGPESGVQFLVRAVGRDEGGFDAHLRHGHADQIERTAVNAGGSHHMVAAGGQVEHGEEVRRLAGGGEHRRRATLQRRDFRGYVIVGGVLQAGVKISAGFQVEQLAHVLAGGVLKCRGLDNGNLPRLAVAGGVSPLNAFCFNAVIAHDQEPPLVDD